HGVREVHGQEARRTMRVGLELLLRTKQGGGDDHRVEAGKRAIGSIERGFETARVLEIAASARHAQLTAAPLLEILRAALEIFEIATEQVTARAPLGEHARYGASDALA